MNGKRVFSMSTRPDLKPNSVAVKTTVTCITDGTSDETLWGLVESALKVRLQIPLRAQLKDGKSIPTEITMNLKDVNARGSGIVPTVSSAYAQLMALSPEERAEVLASVKPAE